MGSIAGAFAIAVSVVVTGAAERMLLGHELSPPRFLLMIAICCIAILYTQARLSGAAAEAARAEALMVKAQPLTAIAAATSTLSPNAKSSHSSIWPTSESETVLDLQWQHSKIR